MCTFCFFLCFNEILQGRGPWDAWNRVGRLFWHYSKKLCVDEAMIDSKCRWLSVTRIKMKKHFIGIKVFKLCNQFGWCYATQMNCKKYLNELNDRYIDKRLTIGSKALLRFIDDNNLEGYELTADSWFINYFGLLKAYEQGTHCNGTNRKNAAMVPYDELRKQNGKILENHQYKIMINNENPIVAVGIINITN